MSNIPKNNLLENDPLHADTSPAGRSDADADALDDLITRLSERRPPAVNWDADFDVDIDRVITNLNAQHSSLSLYIDRHWDDLDANHLARILALYGQNATRIGHLLRDRCTILGPPDDPGDVILTEALAITGAILGVYLLGPDGLDSLDAPRNQIPIDFDHLIADLDDKQTRLSRHIQDQQHDWSAPHLSRLFTVYGQNATRLGRLLRHRRAMYGEGLDQLNSITAENEDLPDLQELLDSLDEPE